MTEQNHISRAWDTIANARIGMLTILLEARADRDAGLIWSVTDIRGVKDDEINADQDIGLVFVDEHSRAYLSITGRASVTGDTAKAKEIWKKTNDRWLQATGGCRAGRAAQICACFAWSHSRPNYGTAYRVQRVRHSNSPRCG